MWQNSSTLNTICQRKEAVGLQAYRNVKEGYGCENYLTNIKKGRLRVLLSHFRVGNHRLQNHVDTSADFHGINGCRTCSAATEGEEHLLMHCQAYNRLRQQYPWVSLANSMSEILNYFD